MRIQSLALSSTYCIISQFWRCSSFVKVCPYVYPSSNLLSLSLFLSPARPLPRLCGLSDLPVNSCGYSELCLCYWKHPSNIPISHDVKMIGCALFGYPFPIAGHGWREQSEMMGLLCDSAKKKKEKQEGGEGIEEEVQTRKDGKKGIQWEKTVTVPCTICESVKQPNMGSLFRKTGKVMLTSVK